MSNNNAFDSLDSKNKKLFKNMTILALGNLASKFMTFLLVPLYTKALTTFEFGVYDLSMSVIQILTPLLTLNIMDAVMIFTLKKPQNGKNYLKIGSCFLFISDFLMALLVILALSLQSSFSFLHIFSGYEFYILICYVVSSWNNLLMLYAKGLDNVKHIAISGLLSSVTVLAGNLYFLLVIHAHLKGFYLANILAQTVGLIYYLIVLHIFHNGNNIDNRNNISNGSNVDKFDKTSSIKDLDKRQQIVIQIDMIKYSMPLIVVTLSWWVNSALDKYVVAFLEGAAATGLLAVAYKIPTILNVIQQIFIQAWHISGTTEYEKHDSKLFYRKIFWRLNGVLCILCSTFIICAQIIAVFLFSGDFYIAWKYTPFLLISCVLNAAAGFAGPVLSAKKDSKSMAMSGLIGSVINAFLNVLLVYLIGIQGATIATAISSLAVFIARRAKTKEIFDSNDSKIIFISWFIITIQAIISILDLHYLLQMASFICITTIYANAVIIEPSRRCICFLKHTLF